MSTLLPATKNQIPDHSIFDFYNKQTYLGNQYVATLASTVGTSETNLLVASNTTTKIGLFLNFLQVASLTALNNIVLKIYANPVVSVAGSAVVPQNLRLYYGNNSLATLQSAPTTTSKGTLISVLSAQPFSVATSDILTIVDNTQSVLITGTASAASTSVETVLGWYEL